MGKSQRHRRQGGLPPDRFLTQHEERRLRQYVQIRAEAARLHRGGIRFVTDEAIVLTLLGTGLRASELCALEIRDTPIGHGHEALYVRRGKGDVERVLEIGPRLHRQLCHYIRRYRPGAGSRDPVFLNEAKRPLNYHNLWRRIRRIGREIGLDLHPHTLRHTHFTRLYAIEHDLRHCQDRAGHKDPKTTAVYAATESKARRRQLQALEGQSKTADL